MLDLARHEQRLDGARRVSVQCAPLQLAPDNTRLKLGRQVRLAQRYVQVANGEDQHGGWRATAGREWRVPYTDKQRLWAATQAGAGLLACRPGVAPLRAVQTRRRGAAA